MEGAEMNWIMLAVCLALAFGLSFVIWPVKRKPRPQITVADFDAAVRQRWSTDTCIIAQYELRVVGETSSLSRGDLICENNKALSAMDAFDRNFRRLGDELKPRLQELRRSLPIDL